MATSAFNYIPFAGNALNALYQAQGARSGSWGTPELGLSEMASDAMGRRRDSQGGSTINPGENLQWAANSVGQTLGLNTRNQTTPSSIPTPNTVPAPTQNTGGGSPSGGGGSPSGARTITEQEAVGMGLDWNNLPSGYSRSAPDQGAIENQMRNEISGAYDAYFRQLDDMMGGFDKQQKNYNDMIGNNYNQGITDLTGQKNMGMTDLGAQRTKNQEQQVKSLRDISDNIRNLFRTGNVMLGTRGAGDSSAANQYAYAVTKVGSRERGNVIEQTRSIENDIAGRESRLNEIYTTESSRLANERNNQLLQVANQFEQARQQLMQQKAQGQLDKGVSLANLSRELLNQATQRAMMIDQDIRNRASMLEQWAMNNAKTIGELRSNMSAIGAYRAPQVQANAIMGSPQFDSMGNMQTSLRPATGYGASNTNEQQPKSLLDLYRTVGY